MPKEGRGDAREARKGENSRAPAGPEWKAGEEEWSRARATGFEQKESAEQDQIEKEPDSNYQHTEEQKHNKKQTTSSRKEGKHGEVNNHQA